MNPEMYGEATATSPVSLNGSAPRCGHADDLAPVDQQSTGCPECQVAGDAWIALVMCLACGWAACSDDSPRQHALAHYQETDHPVTRRLPPGPASRWCYVHRRAV